MEAAVAAAVDGQQPEAAGAVLDALRGGRLSVLRLVGLLERPLTDEHDHEARARAVQLLSQAAAEAPAALQAGDVGVLAEFLGAKLQDWRCAVAAVPGCRALLQRHAQPQLAPLPDADACRLVGMFAGTLRVQTLPAASRLACLELLLDVLRGPFGAPAALGGTDLVAFVVLSIEEETDPRCLLLCLQCVEAVGALYCQPALSGVSHLDDGLEDLFDVGVAPYFPMLFTPPKNDAHRITREQLLARVVAAMAACPQFAALGVPLLSEKLGSSLKRAKEDSLTALPTCLKRWGAAAVKPHLQAVWLMLKAELMAPAADGLLGEQLAAARAAAARAAVALRDSVAALGPGLLDARVLVDVALDDLRQYLGLVSPPWAGAPAPAAAAPGASGGAADSAGAGGSLGSDDAGGAGGAGGWDLPDKAQRRLACIAAAVAAVAAAGGSCTAVCDELLRPALAAVVEDGGRRRPMQANCGVLCVLQHAFMAAAAADAVAEPGGMGGSAHAALAGLAPGVAAALLQLQQQLDEHQGHRPLDEATQAQQLQLWLLLMWQALLSLPAGITRLQQAHLDAAAQQLVRLALHGSSVETELQLARGDSLCARAAAADALVRLASWPPPCSDAAAAGAASGTQALEAHAAPQLLELLQAPSSNGSGAALPGPQAASLLLQQLAGSSAAAAWHVLLWLEPMVLQHIASGAWEPLCALMAIQHGCLPSLPAELAPGESAAAARFCMRVLQAWQGRQQQQQDAPSHVGSTGALVHSCLLLAQLGARCSAADQSGLLLTGCEWAAAAAAAAATAVDDAPHPSEAAVQAPRPACLGLAVLAAARPGLLLAPSVLDLATAQAAMATSSSSWLDRSVAAVALGSVANKCCAAAHRQAQGGSNGQAQLAPEALLAAVRPRLLAALEGGNQQQPGQRGHAAMLGAVQALSWLARGLAMQRHDGWQQERQQLLHLISSRPAACNSEQADGAAAAEAGQQLELSWAAAEFFSVLVASPAPQQQQQQQQQHAGVASSATEQLRGVSLGLQLSQHAVARPLWQQKAFALSLSALAAAVAAQPPEQQQQPTVLWLAVASLLSSAPAAVVAAERQQAVPLLLQALAALSGAWQATPAGALADDDASVLQLLHSCLRLVADTLAAGSEATALLEPRIEQLLDVLAQLARAAPQPLGPAAAGPVQLQRRRRLLGLAADVREAALGCLASALAAVPYHLLHPHRRGVVAAVTAALDDDRRAVRRAAVAARAAWCGVAGCSRPLQ